MRGLTCEKARERRERGLCPRDGRPAVPGGVLCAGCKQKMNANTARLYRVSEATLEAMRRSLVRAGQ